MSKGRIARHFDAARAALKEKRRREQERMETVLIARIRHLIDEWLQRDNDQVEWSNDGTRCLMGTLELSMPPTGWVGLLVGNQYVGGRPAVCHVSLSKGTDREWLTALFVKAAEQMDIRAPFDGFTLCFEQSYTAVGVPCPHYTDVWIKERWAL